VAGKGRGRAGGGLDGASFRGDQERGPGASKPHNKPSRTSRAREGVEGGTQTSGGGHRLTTTTLFTSLYGWPPICQTLVVGGMGWLNFPVRGIHFLQSSNCEIGVNG